MNSLSNIPLVLLDRLKVKERTSRGVAFLANDDLDSNKSCLVDQHVDEASMGNENKVLVVSLPHTNTLLPPLILANGEDADSLFDKPVNETGEAVCK